MVNKKIDLMLRFDGLLLEKHSKKAVSKLYHEAILLENSGEVHLNWGYINNEIIKLHDLEWLKKVKQLAWREIKKNDTNGSSGTSRGSNSGNKRKIQR